MKPVQLILVLACVSFVVMAYFAFEVMLFRLSCALAKLPRPSVPRAVGIVCAVALAVAAAEGVLGFAVTQAYIAGNYPLWEAGLVTFLVGLPVHMAVCATVHAWLMDIKFSDGIAVWKIEKGIKAAVIAVGAGVAGLVFLLS